MTHTIQSDSLEVSIKQVGMELCSIKNRLSNTEYLWQGDPQFWTGQAPILFPIIGLLKENSTNIDGREFAIPKHGIVRNSKKVTVIKSDADTITFQLKWDEESLHIYPFKFVLQVTFRLNRNELKISHVVRNEGISEMAYHLGGHPAFNCPISDDVSYSKYSIEFEEVENSESWLLNSDGLLTDKSKSILESTSKLQLNNNLFDDDALIFRDLKSTTATLKSDITGEILRVEFHDFPYLGIWAKPKAPYVCIEPWIGIADHVNSNGGFLFKEGLRFLDQGSEDVLSYSITILE